MKKDQKEEKLLKKPYYPGGERALKEFISKNLKYPDEAMKHHIEGNVPLRMDISFKGEVTDVKVFSSCGYGLEEEAIRIVKLLKFIVPKVPRGMKVIFHKSMTIHFRYPVTKQQEEKPASPVAFQYQVISSEKTEQVKSPASKVIYQYNLVINK